MKRAGVQRALASGTRTSEHDRPISYHPCANLSFCMVRWGADRAVLVIKKTARWARIRLKIPTIGQESGRGYPDKKLEYQNNRFSHAPLLFWHVYLKYYTI